MNRFIVDLIEQLKGISTRDDLRATYHWLWGMQQEVSDTAQAINEQLRLEPPVDLQPILPCLGVGAHSDLVILAANPGWHPARNVREQGYCVASPDAYTDMMFNFFERHPAVIGEHASWWTKAMSFVPLLPGRTEAQAAPQSVAAKWRGVHEDRILGGWDLFPWHSKQDGITCRTADAPWLKDFFSESVQAVLRLGPKVLFVTSSAGYRLIRDNLLPMEPWSDFTLGSRRPAKGCYARTASGTEIICVSAQLFGNAFRDFKNEDLITKIRELRQGNS